MTYRNSTTPDVLDRSQDFTQVIGTKAYDRQALHGLLLRLKLPELHLWPYQALERLSGRVNQRPRKIVYCRLRSEATPTAALHTSRKSFEPPVACNDLPITSTLRKSTQLEFPSHALLSCSCLPFLNP